MDAEAKQAIKNRDMWKAFGEQFGWTLYGFSYDDSASFLRGPYDASIEITAGARDEINAAIYEAAKEATIEKAGDEYDKMRDKLAKAAESVSVSFEDVHGVLEKPAADELVHVEEYMYMDEGDIDGTEFAADCVYS